MPNSTVLTINLRTSNVDARLQLFFCKLCIGWHLVAGAVLCSLTIKGPKWAYVCYTSKAGYMHKEITVS